ncbi:MAG: R3H domain-containing nucleic acid-binding protein [Candidatus Saccharimonadales bacterium]
MQPRDISAKFLEDLIAFYGVNVLVESEVEEDDGVVNLNVPSTRLNGFLIGSNGDNLRAIQHLVNMSLRAQGIEDTNVTVDIAGYKKQKNDRLAHQAQDLAEAVIKNGKEHEMQPMSSYERRVVHKALGEIEGVTTESIGEGRDRRLVIKPTEIN